ncbi:hypothetical protein KUTeg_004713 [Tegillarca granosa]|uniref:Sphingomyelin phosphodiesterase n=1 Tax=Tegillarca granosa TaxID=220873 RepID=A0ABQ9FHP3_TEGGR|nr:hypothetical protein KUTeg_004713 [Tegillarca granosa]
MRIHLIIFHKHVNSKVQHLLYNSQAHKFEGWFWHVTDFHWDFTYWDRQLSCNDQVPNPGKYGDYWCDAPWSLVNSSVVAMKNSIDNTLHTGDDNVDFEIHDAILGNITQLLKENFPEVPVYATFGNHDYYPHNQFPPHGNELYNRTYIKWKTWINDSSQMEYFLKGGYYSVKTTHGRLRIIGLNTNLYYTSDKLTATLTDPADQLVWLENELEKAKNNNEKVLITGHVPPGITAPSNILWMYPQYNKRINQILTAYSDIIVGQHFGHEHEDSFRVYFKNDKPVMSQFCAPSVTPWRYKIPGRTGPPHNPGVRLIKYNRDSGEHLELVQYYMDLPKTNKMLNPEWEVEYTLPKDYGMSDLSPGSFGKLLTKMSQSESMEFKNYMKWKIVSAVNTDEPKCDINCKSSYICSLKTVDPQLFNKCKNEFVSTASITSKAQFTLLMSLTFVFVLKP